MALAAASARERWAASATRPTRGFAMTVSPISFPNYQVNSTVDPSTWASLSHIGEILKEQREQAEAEKLIAGLFGQSQQQDMSALPPLRTLAQPPAAPP